MIGTLVGWKCRCVLRILNAHGSPSTNWSRSVLTFDYLGALAVSLLFPLVLVPQLGLVRTGFLFGDAQRGGRRVDLTCSVRRNARPGGAAWPRVGSPLAGAGRGLRHVRPHAACAEQACSATNVIYAASTPYQRLVDHALEGRPAPVPQRQPAVLLARRVPLPRGAGAPGTASAAARPAACWCWAAATAWRCARSCVPEGQSTSRWSTSTRP